MAQGMLQRTLRDFLQETEDAISSGRVDVALAHCQSILTSFPESLETHRLLGEVYLAQGKLEEALHSFDWVLTNDPENVIAYCNRALVSERMSDYDTALDCYQQAYELSRGNSQIRQEFNQLSKKAGQQGFMFSRAGLARLYMRGDLVPQALHEWNIVLAASPDRLDARTGLLEACWRDNAFERVVQIANDILQEVPGCVKALLLLAHVTSPRDIAGAQALLRKAEALDPDLVMAQELFADLMASQPDDPFLRLLRKSPAIVGTSSAGGSAVSSVSLSPPVSGAGQTPSGVDFSAVDFQSMGSNIPLDPLANWSGLDGWSNDTTLIKNKVEEASDILDTSDTYKDVFSAWTLNDAATSAPGIAPSTSSSPSLSGLDASPFASWQLEPQVQPASTGSGDPEPWQLLQEALNDLPGQASETPLHPDEASLWNNATPPFALSGSEDQWSSPTLNEGSGQSAWNSLIEEPAENPSVQIPQTPLGQSSPGDDNASAPPAWLSMLTQADRRPTNSSLPVIEQPEPEVSEVPGVPAASQPLAVPPVPASDPVLPWEKSDEGLAIEEGDEELLFGPAWLKSLGATMLDDDRPAETVAPALQNDDRANAELDTNKTGTPKLVVPQEQEIPSWSEPAEANPSISAPLSKVHESSTTYVPWQDEQSELAINPPPMVPEPVYEPWQHTPAASEPTPITNSLSATEQEAIQPDAFDSWKPFEAENATADKIESNLLTTLEELEVQLRSKGFLPLEPNSLASIAQASGVVSTDEPVQEQVPEKLAEESWSEPARSSALAELGSMAQPALADVDPINVPVEPQWLRDLRSTPTPTSSPAPTVPAARAQEVLQDPYSFNQRHEVEPNSVFTVPTTQSQPVSMPSPTLDPIANIPFEPVPAAREPQIERVPVTRSNPNPFLENELETTMRRPAVRLQSLQQRSSSGRDSSGGLISRGRPPVERKEPVVNKIDTANNGSLSYKDRLLKGYQHQLVGSYDDAMQEYRIIIRSAPELLGEVVSNVRALLKIAPRYSAGYRVLGDAYMRQGEYLQAMESYNRALTMAKKGKQA